MTHVKPGVFWNRKNFWSPNSNTFEETPSVHTIHIMFTRIGPRWGHSDLDPLLLKSNHVIIGCKCTANVPHWRCSLWVCLTYCIHKNKADTKISGPFTSNHQILISPSSSRSECLENNYQGVAGISPSTRMGLTDNLKTQRLWPWLLLALRHKNTEWIKDSLK